MEALEAEVERITQPECDPKWRIPGLVVMAATSSGQSYAKCAGVRSLLPSAKPMTTDSVFWIASVTKLMTSIAAMQCVEQGLVSLDEDIISHLPELQGAKTVELLENGQEFRLTPATGTITLRKLLTHTAGFGYDIRDAALLKYNGGVPKAFCGDFENAFGRLPLLYEPGTAWTYSNGIDWVGKLVERLQKYSRLGDYMQERIWRPLGMASTTFHLDERPDLESRLVTMSTRTEQGIEAQTKPVYARIAKDDSGGAGTYSTASDILKLLTSLLLNDGVVLKPATVDQSFTAQLSADLAKNMEETVRHPITGLALGSRAPRAVPLNHGLLGLLLQRDAGTGRRAGTIQWAGYPNLYWWIDRKGGRCGVYCSQLTPTKDASSAALVDKFEEAVYDWPRSTED